MTLRPELLSPATDIIDFGEATKVRIKNTTATLHGKFYRDDCWYIQQLKQSEQGSREGRAALLDECHQIVNSASLEKYPYDSSKPLADRLKKLVENLQFERNEKAKLLNMVAIRDTEIRQLKQAFIDLREQLVDAGKKYFFDTISFLAANKHTR